MKSVLFSIISFSTLLLSIAGCPTTTSDTTNQGVLTAQQQAAVAQVARETVALAAVYGTCAPLADTRADFDADGQVGPLGTCPVVTLAGGSGISTAVLDFGATGCSNSITGGGNVSGSLQLTFTRATRNATAAFQNLTIDGHAVSGDLTVAIQRATDGITLDGNGTLTIDTDTIAGTASVAINSAGLITLTTASLTMTQGTTGYAVTLSNIVLDPINNGNFIPQSGTATFEIPNLNRTPRSTTVVVTFDAQSPVDRTVSVQIGSTSPIAYQLPV